MWCLFGSLAMFFRREFQHVLIPSIDPVLIDQIFESSDPPDSDPPDVHGRPVPRRSTAALHPDLQPKVVALELPRVEAESEAFPFVGSRLTLPPSRLAGSRPFEV